MAKVKNIRNTSGETCNNCGSWIDHWKKISKLTPNFCGAGSCMKKAEHGGHVKRVDISDSTEYILPLCEEHNHYTNMDEMVVWKDYVLVPVKH